MTVIFKSSATADVIMFSDVAYRLMEIMGHEASAKGTLTVAQLPDAIARLRAAIAADKAQRAGMLEEDLPRSEPGESGSRPFVTLTQRATPLLDTLEWSLKKKKPVIWGV